MKRLIVLMLSGMLFLPGFSQKFFNILTEKYSEKDGFSATFITRDMFNLYLKKKQVDEKSPVTETLKNLDNILVVSQTGFGKDKSIDVDEMQKDILNHYKSDQGYTLFKTQKVMGEDLKVYLKKSNETINSLAILSVSSISLNLVELNGVIDMENLAQLGQELNLRGLESLYRIGSGSSFPRAMAIGEYYDRSRDFELGRHLNSQEFQKSLQEQLSQAEKYKELSAEQRKKIEEQFKEQAKQMAEKQAQMAETYREMARKYQRFPIFLSTPGDSNVVYYLNGKKVDASEIKKIDPDDIKTIMVQKSDEKNKKSNIKIETKK